MKINKKTSTAFALLLTTAATAFFAGCGKKEQPARERPPSPVQVATAQTAPVPVMAASFGRMRASSDVDIVPQVSGRIIATPFEEGAHVEAGQILFKIEPDAYQAAVDQAEARVKVAKVDLTRKKATLERNRTLLEQALIAQEDYDKLSSEMDAAEAELDSAEATLVKAKIELDYCIIRAPVSGIAGKRMVDAGNIIAASGSRTLVNVRTIDPIHLDFTLSEAYLPDVRKAMSDGPVEVMILAESTKHEHGLFLGTLTACDNTVDTGSGTISLRATVDNPDGKLWPGQFVYAYPALSIISNAVVVPQSAVTLGRNGHFAYVVSNGTAKMRMVEKGPVFGDAVVALSGIAKGDVVVTAGHLGVWPDAKVAVQEKAAADREALLRRRANDQNVQTLVRVLAAKGDSVEQIAIITGLTEDHVQEIIFNPNTPPEI